MNTTTSVLKIPVEAVIPDDTHGNDRKRFSEPELLELGSSIKARGQLQPCKVVALGDGRFRLVMGERRWRACKMVGIPTIDAVLMDGDDFSASMAMLVENTCRRDLDPIEEAQAYHLRITRFGIDDETLSSEIGVSVRRIRNRLPLVSLSPDIQDVVRTGDLPLTYALTLANMGLDVNRQRIAVQQFRDNPAPRIEWFRALCSKLGEQQSQESLFSLPVFGGVLEEFITVHDEELPPDPLAGQSIRSSASVMALLNSRQAFWQNAANRWQALGRPAKAKQCLAAASALNEIIDAVTHSRPTF